VQGLLHTVAGCSIGRQFLCIPAQHMQIGRSDALEVGVETRHQIEYVSLLWNQSTIKGIERLQGPRIQVLDQAGIGIERRVRSLVHA